MNCMNTYLKKTFIIFDRELKGYFRTPLASIFLLVFLALSSGMTFFLGRFFERDQADLTAFFAWHPWLFLILMPAIGMRLWAEERRSGTIELLMTLPVTNTQLVIGKFLASWIFTLIALILSMPIWITVNYLGNPDNNVIFISYIGSWLMAGAFLALTSCLSTLTKNQVIAFIISSISGFILVMAGFGLVLSAVRSWAPIWLTETIRSMSFLSHFNRIQMGVFDFSTLLFFVSMIVFCLWINIQLVQIKKAD
jgi:ABC-2 type transport system permease protein